MDIVSFRIEESKQSRGFFIVIAKTEDGKEYVCNDSANRAIYLSSIEIAWDLQEPKPRPMPEVAKKQPWNGICDCGHDHRSHGPSPNLNYSAGKCQVDGCKCEHFNHNTR